MFDLHRHNVDQVVPITQVHSSLSDPYDAVGPGVAYNPPLRPPLKQYIEAIVSHVYHPSRFYVQVMPDANTGKRFEELMDNLE